MQLQPGPLPQLVAADLTLTDPDPTFTDIVAADLVQLPYTETLLDQLIDPVAFVPLFPPDDGIGDALDATAAVLGEATPLPGGGVGDPADAMQAGWSSLAAFNSAVDNATGDALQIKNGEQLIDTYSATPAEAFSPVPASLGAYDDTNAPSGSFQQTTKITNLTRPGSATFYPGDQYKITVEAASSPGGGGPGAGILIFMHAVHQYVDFYDLTAGLTDEFGFLEVCGTWGFDAVGDWLLTPYGQYPGLDNHSAFQSIEWTVADLPAGEPYPTTFSPGVPTIGFSAQLCTGNPPPGSAIAVQLTNTTNPGSDTYHVGDSWTLTVNGTPNSPVLVRATQSGHELGWELLGQTNADGVFTWDYFVPSSDYLGTWQEWYQVAGIVWSGSLNFSVIP